jgi:hypothetical protein
MRGGDRLERFIDLYSALPENIAARKRADSEKNMDALLQWGEGQLRTLNRDAGPRGDPSEEDEQD